MSWLREPDAEPIPGYRLIEPLGAGGFGEVWKCVAPGGIFKAIKFVYGNLQSEEPDAARADQEYRALQRIKEVRHPFVLSMDRIEVVEGEIAIVMELADKSLHDVFAECQGQGRQGIARPDLIRYLSDAADALDHLNSHFSLQHLDVKPRNLFVIADRVKVADFGLVKNLERQSSAGVMGGVTPIYAAPETFSGRLSRHCDQYSLAIVFMELLTGKRPFLGKNVRQIALQHMTEPPDLEPLPPGDRAAVARALAKDPNKRFPNCATFVRALAPALHHSQASFDLDEEADLGQVLHANGELEESSARSDDPPPTAVLDRVLAPNGNGNPVPALTLVRTTAAPPAVQAPPPRPLAPTRPAIDLRTQALSRTACDGVLRPTVFVGVGAFGRDALLELRCRLLDRLGDLQQVPAFRFLYLDSDQEAFQKATAGTTEVALATSEVFPLPLQPVGNYRRRMLDHLTEWMPREKLYSIPRSLEVQSSRSLGRLAFCDSVLRFQGRLRRELIAATNPDALLQSAEATRLPAGTSVPRVVVLAGATDGVSGLIADLAYSIRRCLDLLHQSAAPTVAFVYCGTPFDPATPAIEQSNLYATLTELNHYADPGVTFLAQYGPEGPQVTDQRTPFSAVYLSARHERTPAGMRECLAHLATYLTHEVTTPLGAELECLRAMEPAGDVAPFRSFGTATSWYPRGLLLRVSARAACSRVLDVWRSTNPPTAGAEIHAVVARVTADADLRPDALWQKVNEGAAPAGEGTPAESLERFLAGLEAQAAVTEEAGVWALQSLERLEEWIGAGTGCDPDAVWKKSRYYRSLQLSAKQLSESWDERLVGEVLQVLLFPGHRLSNAEDALRRLTEFCATAIAAQWQAIEKHFETVMHARAEVHTAAAQCQGGGGFKLFGGGRQRVVRGFLTAAGRFARLRLHQDLLEAVLHFFKFLQGRLDDRIGDLGFSRQRLKALQQVLSAAATDDTAGFGFDDRSQAASFSFADPFWQSVQSTATVDVVLPAGVDTLEESAAQFVRSLTPDHWVRLDDELQRKVLAPLGNLVAACTGNMNLLRHLGTPLVEQAAVFLAGALPITDVAQVEFSKSRADGCDLAAECRKLAAAATPVLGGRATGSQRAFLVVPDSDAGSAIGELAKQAVPELQLFRTAEPTELTFCREQSAIGLDEFRKMLDLSRMSYQESAPQPATSPHARFDIVEWAPLEP